MSLTIGTRLGPYQIGEQLGAGGMGEVYRAIDVRLDRTVAIKVLPQSLAGDPQGLERFEREAKAIGSLNHPHICVLYDVGRQDDMPYIVMEHIEGPTLEKLLQRGPLPLDSVFEYALQIADALNKAHAHGIVHRDLKPGNIMVAKSGIKLLDFGLAKLREPAGASPLSEMRTQRSAEPLTAQGTILGTLQYMAPEQLEGEEADARTDIFAFGLILYEMTAGKKAFHGKSQASLIGAILKDTPEPPSSLRPGIPPALDRVIGACLEKNPEERWQSVRDMARELNWLRQPAAVLPEHSTAAVSSGRVSRLAWTLVVVFGIGTLGLLLQLYRNPSTVLPLTRLSAELPREQLYNGLSSPGRAIAISPDGRTLVYVSGSPQPNRRIYMRRLDRTALQPVAGTEGAVQPFFSPDGKWLAFFTISGELKKLSLDQGSVPVTLVKGLFNGQWCFGVWRDDNVIIFSAFENLLQVSADGGTPTALTNIDAASSESYHEFPQVVQSTGDVVFTVGLKDGKSRVDLIRKDNKQRSTILQDTRGVLLTHSGQLLFSRDGVMMVAPFDAQQRRISGPAVASPESVVTEAGILRNSAFGNLQAAIADDGTLAYVPPNADKAEDTIGWLDIKGEFAAAGTVAGYISDASLSPDGKTVAFVSDARVSLFDLARSVTTPLNLGDRQTETVSWHPDGKRLTLGGPSLSLYDLDARKETVLVDVGRPKRGAVWSPDGRTVVYMTFNPNNDIYMLTPGASDATPKPFAATDAIELAPAISPDGRLIAYRSSVSGQSNQTNVYVSRFPDGSGIVKVTDRGGGTPFWSADGRSLFFSGPPGVLQTVQVTEGSTIQVGAVQTLFPLKDFQPVGIAPDGKRFLAVRVPKNDPPSQIIVVQNWMQELKRLLPAR